MYLIRLKQVKQAYDAGNYDQASQMLLSDDYLCQRKEGKELLGKLACAFIDRGNSHLSAGRYLQARLDCDNAKKCNSEYTGIIELLDAVKAAENDDLNRQRRNQADLQKANNCINNGRLTMGMKILDDRESLPGASLLREQAKMRQEQLLDISEKLQKALAVQDIDYVLQLVTDLSSQEQSSGKMTDFIKAARDMVLSQIRTDFAAGRLARMIALLEKSRSITAESIEFAEWHDLLNSYQLASVNIENGDYRKALQFLNRVKSIVGDASWLNDLADSVEQTIKSIDNMQLNMPVIKNNVTAQARPKNRPAKQSPCASIAVNSENKHRVLNIDGAGSYMLFVDSKVSVGPISSVEQKDIAIIAPPNSPLVEIHKEEDDYFAQASSGDIMVNGRPQKEALLGNGDKIAVSNRANVKFYRVNPASSTAVIDLTGVRMAQADIKGAIIADSEIIIGSSPSAHIKCKNCESDIVLKVNSRGGLEKDGQELVAGANVEYNKIRVCLV